MSEFMVLLMLLDRLHVVQEENCVYNIYVASHNWVVGCHYVTPNFSSFTRQPENLNDTIYTTLCVVLYGSILNHTPVSQIFGLMSDSSFEDHQSGRDREGRSSRTSNITFHPNRMSIFYPAKNIR